MKLVKQGLGLILQISMFPYACKLKNKFQLEEEGAGILSFCVFLDFAAVKEFTKFPRFKNKCTPAISERYHQRSMSPAL